MLPFFDRRSGVMAAALDLKSSGEIREGSNPSSGTLHEFVLFLCVRGESDAAQYGMVTGKRLAGVPNFDSLFRPRSAAKSDDTPNAGVLSDSYS
jgi:hypothetical protein